MTPWARLLAISLLGAGGLILLLQNNTALGIGLLTMAAGYAFGATANGVSNHLGTSASKPDAASSVSSKPLSNDSTASSFSPVLTLADEGYEDDEFHG